MLWVLVLHTVGALGRRLVLCCGCLGQHGACLQTAKGPDLDPKEQLPRAYGHEPRTQDVEQNTHVAEALRLARLQDSKSLPPLPCPAAPNPAPVQNPVGPSDVRPTIGLRGHSLQEAAWGEVQC